ncbi:MAG: hypothetical protein MJ157_04055, partial [Clostridia bacterium]|nr:hypothetical protein [Clostridia bacterium]
LPGWVAVIIIGREFAVTGLRALVAAEGTVIPAGKLGKIKTVTQIITIVLHLLQSLPHFILVSLIGLERMPELTVLIWNWVMVASLWITVFFTLWSCIDYFNKSWSIIKKGGY